jgi:AraC-like DNA-binding protein
MEADAEEKNKPDSILLEARRLLDIYTKGTRTIGFVRDHNFLPIPEAFDKMPDPGNVCLNCIKYRAGTVETELLGLTGNPCNEIHTNAMKEAARFGGSYTYTCALGFVFWTSPIYRQSRLIGYMLATGIMADDINGKKIKSLAELMHVCAESVSVGDEECHETLRRQAEQQARLKIRLDALKEKYPGGKPEPFYPIEKERMLLAALRQGDMEEAKNDLEEILAPLLFFNRDNFRFMQLRTIELMVLFTRTDINPGYADKVLLEINNFYFKQIQEADTIEKLTDLLYLTVERMGSYIFSFQGIQHTSTLRKAERYIAENYTRKISLQEIAGAAGLSPSYFSTIFKKEMGETLSGYLNHLRVEKAGRMLLKTQLSLSEIASSCGFEDQSWFSKIFKSFTGSSPGKYRSQNSRAVQEVSEINFSHQAHATLVKQDPANEDEKQSVGSVCHTKNKNLSATGR